MRLTVRWRAPQRCETERSDQVFLLRGSPARLLPTRFSAFAEPLGCLNAPSL